MTETNWRAEAESGVDVALAACSLVLGLFSLGTLIAIGYLNYTRLPWFDAWEHWVLYLRSGESWTFLFSQHNEHRIPVSRALYLVDQRWFGADARFLLWCTFLAQFGSALVVYRLASSSRPLSRVTRMQILGLVLTITFAASQWINFTWTFQVCFVIVFFAAIAAFGALSNSVRPSRAPEQGVSAPWLMTAIVMAVIATGSMANGLLVWPLLVVMAACIGLPKRSVGALAVTGGVVIGGYMYGYQQKPAVGILAMLTKIQEIATFAMAYLGSVVDEPFTAVTGALGLDGKPYRVPMATTVGLIGVVCFVRLLIAAVRHRDTNAPSRIALLHCLAFLAASAALTAVGRVQFPIEDALTSRYVTPSLLFWACLTALTISGSVTGPGLANPARWRLRLAALMAAAFVVLPVQLAKVTYAADSERYMSEGEYAVINDIFSPEGWERFIGPMSGRMIPVVRYFREHHLASFSREWTHWLGDPVRAHFIVESKESDCRGEWESVSGVGGSLTPAALGVGWGYDRRFNRAPDRIVFVDDMFRIVGFATSTRRRPDLIARYPELPTERLGWVAYLPAGISAEMTALVLLGDGRSLCRVGRAHVPGNYLTAPAAKAGTVIAGVEVNVRGWWIKNLRPSGAAAPPFATDTWSSGLLESPSGELRFGPVKLTAGASVGLPLITGPAASAVTISAIERETGDVLAATKPPAGAAAWDLWRLDMPPGAPDMLIDYVVEQGGTGAGNWVLVGPPRLINP